MVSCLKKNSLQPFHSFFLCTFAKRILNNMDNYIVSARKYRPMSFDTVVGQEALTTTLKNAIQSGRLAHAYLFCGPRGVGKTTCARIFAKTINCLSPQPNGEACGECESCKAFDEQRSFNIHELDAASNNSVDDIRQLIDQVMIPPQIGKYKVFIIDEVHMLSAAAFNAFLKTLEEPPKHAIFILATTEKHKILPTILSRCQIYDFKRMTVDNTVAHLKRVAEKEGITVEDAALNVIAQKADGGMRDALSIFDQVASFCGGNITYQQTIHNLNVLDYDYYFRLTDYFLGQKITECMLTLNEILTKGFEGQYFITGLSTHFRNLLVSQDEQTADLIEASQEVRNRYKEQAKRCKPQFLFKAMKLSNQCDLNYKQSQNKRLLIELTLIEMAQLSSDDGTSSGHGPTMTLKPIFAKMRGTATAPSQATANPQATAKQTVQTATQGTVRTTAQGALHASMKPPLQSSASHLPPSSQQAKPQPTIANRMMSFSIRNGNNASKQEVKEDQPTYAMPTTTQENQPVDNVNLTIIWREFAQSLPKEYTAMAMQMDILEPAMQEDGTTFLVIADNPSFLNSLNKIKPRIEQYLRSKLHNSNLTMTTRLREITDKKRTYTKTEYYNMMLKESEGLRKLRETFNLELS